MSKNTIKINGNELKRRIECDLKMSIYEIATDNGYSRNLVAQAIRTGKASPVVQTLLRLYNIKPEEYELKEIKDPEPPKKGQMSFDDLAPVYGMDPALLKQIIKEAIKEAIHEYNQEIKDEKEKEREEFRERFRENLEKNLKEGRNNARDSK